MEVVRCLVLTVPYTFITVPYPVLMIHTVQYMHSRRTTFQMIETGRQSRCDEYVSSTGSTSPTSARNTLGKTGKLTQYRHNVLRREQSHIKIYSTVQYSTVQYSTVQYSTLRINYHFSFNTRIVPAISCCQPCQIQTAGSQPANKRTLDHFAQSERTTRSWELYVFTLPAEI